MKKCIRCEKLLPLDNFTKDMYCKDGYNMYCKQCRKLIKQKSYHKHIVKIKIKDKENRNTDYFKKRLAAYRKNKWYTDPAYRIKELTRGRMRAVINKEFKVNKSSKLLGCTWDYYKEYIEGLMLDDMTWDNHGTLWVIDHIIPCAYYDLNKTEEQQKCFNYRNTRPLYKEINDSKNSYYNGIRYFKGVPEK